MLFIGIIFGYFVVHIVFLMNVCVVLKITFMDILITSQMALNSLTSLLPNGKIY